MTAPQTAKKERAPVLATAQVLERLARAITDRGMWNTRVKKEEIKLSQVAENPSIYTRKSQRFHQKVSKIKVNLARSQDTKYVKINCRCMH